MIILMLKECAELIYFFQSPPTALGDINTASSYINSTTCSSSIVICSWSATLAFGKNSLSDHVPLQMKLSIARNFSKQTE
jgi:hypothetical protein